MPFDCEWLRLREPIDAASRAPGMAQTLRQVLPDRPVQIIDLGSGTGANLRYLTRLIGGRQEWWLIDHDRALLEAIPACMQAWGADHRASVRRVGADLLITGRGFECLAHPVGRDLAAELAAIELPAGALVSASALLDLVSEAWLRRLAQRCARARAPVLFALSYDGRMDLQPPEPGDERVCELVNRHQTTDKGFGAALGPAAGAKAARLFSELGYRVHTAPSDWHIGPDARAMQEALLGGWLAAAVATAPEHAPALQDWAGRRRAHVGAGRCRLRVGHTDLIGWPAR